MKRSFLFIFCFLFLFPGESKTEPNCCNTSRIDEISFEIGETLATALHGKVNKRSAILAASIVSVDEPDRITSFGRLLGDWIGASLAMFGYTILEPRMRVDTLTLTKGGKLVLSDDREKIAGSHEIEAVIAGTYTISGNTGYISVNVIETGNHTILAASTSRIHLNETLLSMMGKLPEKEIENAVKKVQKNGETKNTEGPLGMGLVTIRPKTGIGTRVIQNRLAELGYYTSAIDGKWGKETGNALAKFKKDHGLPKYPFWNLPTQKKLFHASGQ